MASKTTPLAERAAHLQAELDAVRRVQKTLAELREVFTKFPELRTAFGSELALLAGKPDQSSSVALLNGNHRLSPTIGVAKSNLTNVERIVRFLQTTNEAVTADVIAEGTGIPITSVRHTLYTRHAERFQQVDMPGKKTFWTLSEEGQKTASPPTDRR